MTPEEERYLRTLGEALGVLDDWESRTGTLSGAWKAQDGSELAKDDAVADPYQVSPAAWAAITAAVSHLGCLRDSLFHTTGPNHVQAPIHTHGQLTLIRGALENASMAVWLLEDDDPAERILRRLQTDWDERRELDNVRAAVREESQRRNLDVGAASGSPSPKTMSEHFIDLSAIAARVGIEPNKIKKRPGYGDIVKAVGKDQADGSNLAFIVWKACSAIAHGELRGSLAYLSKDILGEPAPGTFLARLSGNVQLMATGGLIAIGTVRKAFDLYAKRARSSA